MLTPSVSPEDAGKRLGSRTVLKGGPGGGAVDGMCEGRDSHDSQGWAWATGRMGLPGGRWGGFGQRKCQVANEGLSPHLLKATASYPAWS